MEEQEKIEYIEEIMSHIEGIIENVDSYQNRMGN